MDDDGRVNFESEFLNARLRMKALHPSGSAFDVRIEQVDGKRMWVAHEGALEVGTAVQLDGPDRILFAEAISVERHPGGSRALLEVRQFLLRSDVQQVRSNLEVAEISAARAASAQG